jgi:hypothetical protein
LKRLVNLLLSSQNGFQKAIEIHLKQQSVNWALQEQLDEMRLQAWHEWVLYHMDLHREASGKESPEDEEVFRKAGLAEYTPRPISRIMRQD